jgi:hypothetical protein
VELRRFAGEPLSDRRSQLCAGERLIADDRETAHLRLLRSGAHTRKKICAAMRTPAPERVNPAAMGAPRWSQRVRDVKHQRGRVRRRRHGIRPRRWPERRDLFVH